MNEVKLHQKSHWDPRTKLILVISIIIAGLGSSTWQGLGLILLFLVLWSIKESVPIPIIVRSIRTMWLLVFFTIAMHTFFSSGIPEIQLVFIPIHYKGLLKGLLMAAKLLLIIWAASILTASTSPLRLTQGLDALLSPLRRWRLPAGEAAMIIGIGTRFLPVLSLEAKRIREAQALRGLKFNEGNLLERVRYLIPVLVPLLGAALRRADELGDAMEARAYRPASPRTFLSPLQFTTQDKLLSAGSIITGAIIAILL